MGQSISVSVLVDSGDIAMNGALSILSFPPELLRVTAVSRGGSIMSLWAEEPFFSNQAGTINFAGVVLNPGFSGSAGNLITINFMVKAAGVARVSFGASQVLANDCSVSDILSGTSGARFTLTKAGVPPRSPSPSPDVTSLVPPAITEYPNESDGIVPLLIRGTSIYPFSVISVRMRREGDLVSEQHVPADGNGNFSYTNTHELAKGEYIVTASVSRDDGATSVESAPAIITVANPFAIYLGKLAVNIFMVLIIFLLGLFLLTLLCLYLYFRLVVYRRRVHMEAHRADESLTKSMELIEDDVNEFVSSKNAAKELKDDVEDLGKFVGRKIRDIESLQ